MHVLCDVNEEEASNPTGQCRMRHTEEMTDSTNIRPIGLINLRYGQNKTT